ncbi:hypothetical protein [Paraburkholderia terrae]
MKDCLQALQPVPLDRPRGAHRLEAFSPKLNRRITFSRCCAFDQWILIETDPAVRTFCERPGYVQLRAQQQLADFWVSFADRQELILLPGSVYTEDRKRGGDLRDACAIGIRTVSPADLAASRTWIENWKRMLPCIVVTRGLVPAPLLDVVESFICSPQSLISIERKFSEGDPILARAAVFRLLYAGRASAPELRTDALSPTTRFVCQASQS